MCLNVLAGQDDHSGELCESHSYDKRTGSLLLELLECQCQHELPAPGQDKLLMNTDSRFALICLQK